MTNPIGGFLSITGKHSMKPGDRLFSPVNDLLIILSAITHASSLMVDGSTHKHPQPTMRLNTKQMGCAYVIPLRGPLEHALAGTTPDRIEIGMTPSATHDNKLHGPKLHTGGLDSVMTHVISPIFITFFERYNDWMTENYSDAINWPMTLNFARIIRNAAAHGKINFRNPRAPAVSWRGLSYSPADNGRQVIGLDIRMGDVLGLMFDANEELNKFGVPVL